MSRYSRLIALFMAVAASAGCNCGGSSAPDGGPAEIELGTGSLVFEPLADEQDLLLVTGAQGGFHFIANSRMRGLLPGNPSEPGELGNPVTTFYVFREDGTRIDAVRPPYRLGYREADDGWLDLPSGRILQVDQGLVDAEGVVPAIYRERVRLRVEIEDARGDEAASERWVVPIPDERPDAGLFQDAGVDARDASL